MLPVELSPECEEAVIRRLAVSANQNKVVEELCLEYGWRWEQAQALVDDLIRTNNLDITRQQSPLLVLISFSIFIGGVLLVAWHFLGILNYFWPSYTNPNAPDMVGLYWFYSNLFQTVINLPQAFTLFLTGLAMIGGSYLGMKDVWAAFFDMLDYRRAVSLYPIAQGLSSTQPVPGNSAANMFAPTQPSNDLTESPAILDESIDYIEDRLKSEWNEPQLVEELWFKYGLSKSQGYQLVRQVLTARGISPKPGISLVLVLLALAAFFAGAVWVFQFLILVSGYLAANPREITNLWHIILRLGDIGDYIERFPWLFVLFALGLVLLVGGFYGIENLWPSIFLLDQKSQETEFVAEGKTK